jgi:hypothetical protein
MSGLEIVPFAHYSTCVLWLNRDAMKNSVPGKSGVIESDSEIKDVLESMVARICQESTTEQDKQPDVIAHHLSDPFSALTSDPTESSAVICAEILDDILSIACCSVDEDCVSQASSTESLPVVNCRVPGAQDEYTIEAVRLQMEDEDPPADRCNSEVIVIPVSDGDSTHTPKDAPSAMMCENISTSQERRVVKAAADCVQPRADSQSASVVPVPQEEINQATPPSQVPENDDTRTDEQEFEPLWNKRKAEVEKSAESRAAAQFRQWKRDRVSLESAIDASLKEYGEMYEKAHALRLLFEEEKRQWAAQVEQMSKRQCVRAAEQWPSWPPVGQLPYAQDQDQRARVDRPFPEFEYTAYDDLLESAGCESPRAQREGAAMVTPQRVRAGKKFTVPLKHGADEL